MAAIVEGTRSEGIVWPAASAVSGQSCVVDASAKDPRVAEKGEQGLGGPAAGTPASTLIIEDRQVRAGVKFSDAELGRHPFRVTIGKRAWTTASRSSRYRATGEDGQRSRSTRSPKTSAKTVAHASQASHDLSWFLSSGRQKTGTNKAVNHDA